jgi:hypothetical protein
MYGKKKIIFYSQHSPLNVILFLFHFLHVPYIYLLVSLCVLLTLIRCVICHSMSVIVLFHYP